MVNGKKFLLDWLKYLSQGLSLMIFLYIFATHTLNIVTTTDKFIDKNIFEISYLRSLLFLGFALGFISWIIYVLQKKTSFISPLTHNRSDQFYFISIASFLSIFYIGIFSYTNSFQYIIFFLLLILFYIFIPQLINSYLAINYAEIKSHIYQTFMLIKKAASFNSYKKQLLSLRLTPTDKIQEINKKMKESLPGLINKILRLLTILVFTLFSLSIIILTFFYIAGTINSYIRGNIYQENLKRGQFLITKITPQKVLSAHRVTLAGYHFYSKIKGDSRYSVMTSDGPIRLIEEWTNERLDFTVPLDFPTGKKEVWIERPTDDPNSNKIVRSNTVSLEVFSRFNLYPTANDSFYQKAIKKVKRLIYFNIPILSSLMLF